MFNCLIVYILLIFHNISDSKRQQTTTVDYNRLINGLVLMGFAFLQGKTLTTNRIQRLPYLIGNTCDWFFCLQKFNKYQTSPKNEKYSLF